MPENIKEGLVSASGWIVFLAAGGFGGLARYLHELAGNRRRFSWFSLSSSMFIGGFIGWMLGLMSAHYGMDDQMQSAISGAAGAVGWPIIDNAKWLIRQKFTVTIKE